MVDNSILLSLFITLGIVGLVLALIKYGFFDAYVPHAVIIRHENNQVILVIKTKRRTVPIRVRDFQVKDYRDVLVWRLGGLEFGRYRIGKYKGKYGEVVSYASSDSGLLIEATDGKRYYLAFDNIHEVIDAILDESIKEKVIEVRK
ncbi:hypothetical protein OCC_09431 [Thermococcus litoralis DSM 5473]|jgi:hypothetical protein|uniref:Uncharacterized protein n=2 Tax=Thermococcaceae TaxID=2259 RepID=H3ZQR3_THELN|nr:hypothetical protein ADU37_CDS01370 [Thermococcus sp. 2319x1]EHR77639.1 hypothetical protein OCC_09431 [Thermococcus litoralis DSM 5473]KUJ98648.1 MAG: Uncharacterized protein XD43_1686 [Thermococcales archaeon 44_46]